MLDLQKTYATYMKPLGLKKGKTTQESKARHEDIMKFYKDISASANLTVSLSAVHSTSNATPPIFTTPTTV